MLTEGMVFWTIIAGVFLAMALATFFFAEFVYVRRRSGSLASCMDAADGGGEIAKILDRRRSKRFVCQVRVFVYGHALGKPPFYEEATTLEVSSHGGLLTLAASIFVGQKLLLTNMATWEEEACRIVRFTPKHGQKREVAIEFAHSAPGFWQTHAARKQAVY
jgi:hypothetical protein